MYDETTRTHQRPGIECPVCGGATSVLRTYNYGHEIRRIRQCRDLLCDTLIRTKEVVIAEK